MVLIGSYNGGVSSTGLQECAELALGRPLGHRRDHILTSIVVLLGLLPHLLEYALSFHDELLSLCDFSEWRPSQSLPAAECSVEAFRSCRDVSMEA